MKSDGYDAAFVKENMMGPNSMMILEEIADSLKLERGMRVLDLGCGKGLTSIFLAEEYDGSSLFLMGKPVATISLASCLCSFVVKSGCLGLTTEALRHKGRFSVVHHPHNTAKSQYDVLVFATDLWIDATENYRRIQEFGLEDRIIPIHAEAHDLPF